MKITENYEKSKKFHKKVIKTLNVPTNLLKIAAKWNKYQISVENSKQKFMFKNYCKFQKLLKILEKLPLTIKITLNLQTISEHQNLQHMNVEKFEQKVQIRKTSTVIILILLLFFACTANRIKTDHFFLCFDRENKI